MALSWIASACTGTSSTAACREPGQALLDSTCVSQQVADFVMCIRSRGSVELKSDRNSTLALDAEVAGQHAASAIEVQTALEAKYDARTDADAERQIIERCAAIVGAAASRSPTSKGSAAALQTPKALQRIVWMEDFSSIGQQGTLPDGWIGGDYLGVLFGGGKRFLAAMREPQRYPKHDRVTVPVVLVENFEVSIRTLVGVETAYLELTVGSEVMHLQTGPFRDQNWVRLNATKVPTRDIKK